MQETDYTYDNAGNLLTVKSGVNTLKSYTYDAWGRQTGYAEPQNLVTASYTYGADGLRKSKTVGCTTTTFVWDGQNMVYESSGTVYTYGVTLIKSSNGAATYVYVFNGHGDVVQLLAGESVVKSYSYDAFGNEIGINMADTNPFRYCGEYYDKESETIYLRARYYNPSIGRFNQEDTHWHPGNMIYGDNPQKINESKTHNESSFYAYVPDIHAIMQSGNLYGYCGNNPVIYVDFNGKFVISTTALLVAGGIALFGTIGGIIGNHVANERGATGWKKAGYIAGGAVVGGH